MGLRVMLFCEDAAHESWARAAVDRIAVEEGVDVSVRVGSARSGVGRLKRELRAFDHLLKQSSGLPDLLLVLVDGNTVGVEVRRREIADSIDLNAFPAAVVGVPDPEIECWYVGDPASFRDQFGTEPDPNIDCKTALTEALSSSGEIVVSGGAEFADELVGHMDLYRAGKRDRSFKRFFDDLRTAIRSLKG